MTQLQSVAGRGVAFVALAVGCLSFISAITLRDPAPVNAVPEQLYTALVAALWVTGGLALLVGALPVFRRRVGESRLISLSAAIILVCSLVANAASLSDEVARFPQSYTSMLGAVLALVGATLSALSIAARESVRDDYSSL